VTETRMKNTVEADIESAGSIICSN